MFLAAAPAAWGDTLTGSSALYKSSGSATLSSSGFIGTYLTVPAGGATVNFSVNATEGAGSGTPHMNLSIADSLFGFNVASTSATDYTTSNITLAPGTYFIRNERDYAGNAGNTRPFTINNLTVNTVSGSAATFNNVSNDATALAASNTYIDNYRKGAATVAVTGTNNIPLLAGTPVKIYTARNAFNFGGTVSGSSNGDSKDMLTTSPPAAGTEQFKFQQFINRHFNMIVPSNAGKWANNEATQNNVNMTLVDKQLNYAQSHQMRARMHNLIWGSGATGGSQQPTFVNNLIASAAAGSASDKNNLTAAINSRINYYIGGVGNRALKYAEIDGLNESLHNPSYWNIYGASGLASIYNSMQGAISTTGSSARIMLNEYNVLQFSPASIDNTGAQSGSDPYGNYYKNHVESIRAAGGAMGGIGFQEYASVSSAPSANAAMQALQNLSTQGIPLSLTEFGMSSGATKAQSQASGPGALETAMRMMYGTPLGQTVMIWGWWDLTGATYPPAALLDNTSGTGNNAVLTPIGTKWESLMSQFNTNTTVNLAPDGTVSFTGAYGDYYLSGQGTNFTNANVLVPDMLPYDMTLTKGTTNYNTTLAKPPDWFQWKANASGSWVAASNWTDAPESGGTPSGAGLTAYFGSAATSYNLTSGAATSVNLTNAITVTVTSPVTAGMIVFDRAIAYTIAGATISLQGYNNPNGHVAAIYDNNGNHSITAPVALIEDTTITVAQPANTLTVSNLQSTTAALTKSGPGTLVVNAVRASSLNVNVGLLRLSADGSANGVSDVAALSIAPSAKIDLTNNHLITASPAGSWNGSAYTGITGQIATGRNAGAWDGSSGIVTSQTLATNSALTSIGVATASDIGITATAVWAGQTVSPTDTLVMYTYGGDATLDGKINIDDYVKIDNGLANNATGWSNGDFNYDGKVNIDDYTAQIDANIGNQTGVFFTAGGTSVVAIPEPAAGAAIAPITFLLAATPRRRRATRQT